MRLGICVLLQLCVFVAAQRTALDSFIPLQLYRSFRQWIFQTLGSRGQEGARLLTNARENNKVQDILPDYVPFPCDLTNARSVEVPTSVHRLRPGDIDVIGAIGDSLTAGAGILSTIVEQVVVENRGVSALGGGQGTWREYLTVPNIFKVFNPRLIGYAYGDSLTIQEDSQLNVAESGAMSTDLPYMTEVLIKRIKRDPRIDVNKQWKLIAISMGANDFCVNFCAVPTPLSLLDYHRRNLLKTLRLLRDNLPRTLVVIASAPQLKALVDTDPQSRSLLCYLTTMIECSCFFALQFRERRLEYYDAIRKWQKLEEDIIQHPEFRRDDFEVVSAPCLQGASMPRLPNGKSDTSYLAADCFHVSQKSDAMFANCVWNNMLEPTDRKTPNWTPPYERFLCPTEKRPYLMTHKNSPK